MQNSQCDSKKGDPGELGFLRLAIFLSLLGLQACNYNHVHDPSAPLTQGQGPSLMMLTSLDYSSVQQKVLAPRCLSCHSATGGNQGGLNLESYSQVRGQLNKIYSRTIEKRDMPPAQSLPPPESDLLKSWIELGAPERNLGHGGGGEIKGPITWKVVREKVFSSSCLDCHSGPTPEKGLDLESLEQVKKNIDLIFKRAVVELSMPLEPYPALTSSERQALMTWIAQGMPE